MGAPRTSTSSGASRHSTACGGSAGSPSGISASGPGWMRRPVPSPNGHQGAIARPAHPDACGAVPVVARGCGRARRAAATGRCRAGRRTRTARRRCACTGSPNRGSCTSRSTTPTSTGTARCRRSPQATSSSGGTSPASRRAANRTWARIVSSSCAHCGRRRCGRARRRRTGRAAEPCTGRSEQTRLTSMLSTCRCGVAPAALHPPPEPVRLEHLDEPLRPPRRRPSHRAASRSRDRPRPGAA